MKVRSSKSITLAEILVAGAILIFAAVAITQFYLTSIALSDINKDEVLATEHLTNVMEAVRCTPFSNIVVDFPDGVINATTSAYYETLVGNYDLANEYIVVSYVNTTDDPLEILITLGWQDKRGNNIIKHLVTKRTR